jgi:hypothetical protein
MMNFILRLQPAQDRDCALDGRFINGNRLESSFKCRIFSDGFAVLVSCGTSRSRMRDHQNSAAMTGELRGEDKTSRCRELVEGRRASRE